MRRGIQAIIVTLLCCVIVTTSTQAFFKNARIQTVEHSDKEKAQKEVMLKRVFENNTASQLFTELGFDPDVDYLAEMKSFCLNGDAESGRCAAIQRNMKIDYLGLDVPKIDYDDLLILSKIITDEAGATWLSPEWKMMVGEVVVNRKNSPEFPDTLYDVIHQRGQYAKANTSYFSALIPLEDCVDAAAKLLSGQRLLNDPTVVFQSGAKQGSGVAVALYDEIFGHTYLCYSSHPELYK